MANNRFVTKRFQTPLERTVYFCVQKNNQFSWAALP